MSKLQFQERMPYVLEVKREIEVLKLRFFDGKIIDNMPLLLSGRDENGDIVDVQRTPMTLKQLLDERVNGTFTHDRDLLRNKYADVAFFGIENPDNSGEIKYALYSHPLAKELFNTLTPESNINNGKLVITTDQYNLFSKEDCLAIPPNITNDLRKDPYSHQDIRREIWIYGAEGNDDLIDGNLDLVKQIVGGDFSNRMGIFPSYYPGFGSWYVGRLVGGYRSDAFGRFRLDDYGGRLFGVAPKAQSK